MQWLGKAVSFPLPSACGKTVLCRVLCCAVERAGLCYTYYEAFLTRGFPQIFCSGMNTKSYERTEKKKCSITYSALLYCGAPFCDMAFAGVLF